MKKSNNFNLTKNRKKNFNLFKFKLKMVLRFFEAFERTKRRKKLLIKTSLIQFQRVHLLPIGLKFHEISIGMADENVKEFKLEIFNIEKK